MSRRLLALLTGGWVVVLKRARADWLILGAALLTMLLATTLLAAAPIYAGAVAQAGLRRTLHDAAPTDADIQVSTSVRGDQYKATDSQVLRALGPILSLTGGVGTRTGTSGSFGLPAASGQSSVDTSKLAVFAFFDRIEQHARLVAGVWPSTTTAPYQVAIPEPTAAALGLKLNDTLTLTDRLDDSHQMPVRVIGIYRMDDPKDPFWFGNQLATNGIVPGISFTSYGPFVVTSSVFFGPVSTQPATVDWRLYPDIDHLSVDQVPALRTQVQNLSARLGPAPPGETFTVTTQLSQILDTTSRSLLVTRTAVLLLTIQLAILATYALVLTAGLIDELRRGEFALLRSRGAATSQLLVMALLEGLLLALPAVVAGPWLAAWSLRGLNLAGPLAGIGLSLQPRVNGLAFLLAGAGGLVCLGALIWPAIFTPKVTRERSAARNLVQRAGIDLGLLLIAAIGYWQLKHYGAPLTKTVQGRLGIDPLLVAVPAIGLVAGAVFALRLIPLLARLADGAAARRRAAVVPLGAWQLARRPLRYARVGLLLMLALGIGLFAVSYSRTWSQSQGDQADFQVGADLRLTPDRRPGSIPELDLTSAQELVPGVQRSLPVARQFSNLPQGTPGNGVARLILLDSAEASGVVRFRDDLSDTSFSSLMQRLGQDQPDLATIPLPGQPARLRLDLQTTLDPLNRSLSPQVVPEYYLPSLFLSATLRDGDGTLQSVDLGQLSLAGKPQSIVVSLADQLPSGKLALPHGPLSLVQLELREFAPLGISRTVHIMMNSLAVSDAANGQSWQTVPLTGTLDSGGPNGGFTAGIAGTAGGSSGNTTAPGGRPIPQLSVAPTQDGGLALALVTATSFKPALPVNFSLRPSGSKLPEAIPVVVDQRLLALLSTNIGGSFPLDIGGGAVNATVVGTVRSFPTVDPDQMVVLADLGTLSDVQVLARGGAPIVPDERWLALAPGKAEPAAKALQAPPYSSPTLVSRFELARSLRSDPVALGTIGALSLGFLAAAVFAGIGFAVSAAVSVRERLAEFALLRALGLSVPQLAGWLSLEQGILIALSLIGGSILGLALAWLVLPLITVTQAGASVVPGLIVVVPWGRLLLLEVAVVAALIVVVAILAALLRRVGIGAVLRMGVE